MTTTEVRTVNEVADSNEGRPRDLILVVGTVSVTGIRNWTTALPP